VVSDRFTDSSYAYQVDGRGLDRALVEELERKVVGLKPGLTLLLDLDVREGRARTSGRDLWPDRIESEQDDFFERVREGFRRRATAEADRFRVIDASQSPEAVGASVAGAVTQWLEGSA
jgi:dTMP kinase